MDRPSLWNGKRYYSLNAYLRNKHGEKIGKLSLDAGLGCPNRDGSVGRGGCIFCGEDGAGTFAGCSRDSIELQMASQKRVQREKWKVNRFIAYFQSYSNTYADVGKLRSIYDSALADEEVCALAIATRPDCLEDDVVELLAQFNEKTHLWVELGLQTMHEATAEWLNRGYGLTVFESAVRRLQAKGIDVVVHVILGLPQESEQDMMATIDYLSGLGIAGIKIHLLHVIENTRLAELYERGAFKALDQEAYIGLVVKAIEKLPKDVVVHRLTGDGSRKTLIAPKWPLNKRGVLNGIDKRLRALDTWQGKNLSQKKLEKQM